ncbi:hypothetical protein F9288_00785 [Sphingomonas sp. CL5.1]|uniref:alpha/beta hydrolase family protein n=1 Tax=Sphingomonas sp. CL5.1 TaxID=2653203 RepID=UPI00158314CA|nr:acetylxylan esterase [Sphingomonas sp. CL5.1]QKR98342.1 hypothetical protein F9288_00785 [Sphingomonas sp. CL5.1]
MNGKFGLLAAVLPFLLAVPAESTTASAPSESQADYKAFITALDSIARQSLNARAETVKAIDSAEKARARQEAVRMRLLALMGGLPDRKAPLNAIVTGRFEGPGLRGENIVFESLPGLKVAANFYRPADNRRVPVVLALPGHSENGKEWLAPFAVEMVGRGFAVLAIDFVGEGERLQYPDGKGGSVVGKPTLEHSMDAFPVMLLGDNLARYFINDAMRALDYLGTRDDIDPERMATYGCSGGGTIAGYLAALDSRVKAAAVACWVTDYESSIPLIGPQEAEQSIQRFVVEGFDLPDWVELAAPKPYAIVSTTEDFFPIQGAAAAYVEARQFWSLLGKPDSLQWIVGPGPHGNVIPLHDEIGEFFAGAFNVPPKAGGASADPVGPAAPRQVTPTGQVTGKIGDVTIQSINRERLRAVGFDPRVFDDGKNVARLRDRIRNLAGIEVRDRSATVPKVQLADPSASYGVERIRFASRLGEFPALKAAPASGPGPGSRAVILIGDAKVEEQMPRVKELAQAGWTVLALQARGADNPEANRSGLAGGKNILALRAILVGKTLPGITAEDILQTVDWLASQGHREVRIMASGAATVAALHAAVLDDRVSALSLENGLVSWRAAVTAPIQKNLAEVTVPGALRFYDIPVLVKAVFPRSVEIKNPTDAGGNPISINEFRKFVGKIPNNIKIMP